MDWQSEAAVPGEFLPLGAAIGYIKQLRIRVWTPLSTGTQSFLFPYPRLPGKIVLAESAAFVYPAFIIIAVAWANKNARIIWSILNMREEFNVAAQATRCLILNIGWKPVALVCIHLRIIPIPELSCQYLPGCIPVDC